MYDWVVVVDVDYFHSYLDDLSEHVQRLQYDVCRNRARFHSEADLFAIDRFLGQDFACPVIYDEVVVRPSRKIEMQHPDLTCGVPGLNSVILPDLSHKSVCR